MSKLRESIKSTLLGGVLFLIPAVVLILVVQKAMQFARHLSGPAARAVMSGNVHHPFVATLVAILLLVILCLVAGLVARTRTGKRSTKWLEDVILGNFPGYQMVKSMTQSLISVDESRDVTVALARIEDAWQLAYVLEEHDNGLLTVFVPQAPSPMSGSVYYLEASRVKRLDVSVARAGMCVKRLGLGSKELLRGKW